MTSVFTPTTAQSALSEQQAESGALAAQQLQAFLSEAPAEAVIGAALGHYGERFAIVSSFGAESAVLLHMASRISKSIPVLFLDTGKLFGETKRYRDTLIERLGLTDVRTLSPSDTDLNEHDPKGHLWSNDTNRCCFIRKVMPLHRALEGFDAWASGRKRFQGGLRTNIDHFEFSDARTKVNPLALWTRDDVKTYMALYDLPQHPLLSEGFSSIGCMPCTDRVDDDEDPRAGRWKGRKKSECGIHLNLQENKELFDDGSGI